MTALLLAFLTQASGKVEFLPGDLLYRHYLADPRGPTLGTRFQRLVGRGGDLKVENSLGGHLALARLAGTGEAFELEGEACAFGRFDPAREWDMDGVDFRFGFPLVYRRDRLAFKLHLWHITSHLGDEIIEREGLRRIKYARNELAPAVSWNPVEALRLYGEIGWAFKHGEPNRPWRWQAGAEAVGDLFGAGAPEAFAAANWTSFQELDWEGMFTAQAGVWFRSVSSPHGIRFGLEYFRGHSALTQFFRQHEQHWAFGFWIAL